MEFNKYRKSDKGSCIIYVDFKCLIEKIDGCENNSEYSSTTKEGKHIPLGFPMFTTPSCKSIKKPWYIKT